jgi:hypothetical protein
MYRVQIILALLHEFSAKPFHLSDLEGVTFPADPLVRGSALRFAPECAPAGKPGWSGDGRMKVRLDHCSQPVCGPRTGMQKCGFPVPLVFVGKIGEGFVKQILLAFEMEQDKPMADPGLAGNVGEGQARKATCGDDHYCGLDHLLPPLITRQGPPGSINGFFQGDPFWSAKTD